ncbi:hypothetical protein [Bradyrhizobium nitroreducens]|uniref:hypothetical protein n=1 Tax=Bradyrhizobium nitroreducens TaxID=709803 RepID=UPI000C1EAE0B|nr:hypothetical protein [Bradyrhizobium nitroreducens]
MHLAVTIKHDKDLEEVRGLIRTLRGMLSADSVTVLEAPEDLEYPYPFPVVTISEDRSRNRLFGADAIEKLRAIAHPSK